MAQDIARVYQQCDPAKPLKSGDPRYVSFTESVGRAIGDTLSKCDSPLRRAAAYAFAGHRGGGKSTELLRLEDKLSNPPADTESFSSSILRRMKRILMSTMLISRSAACHHPPGWQVVARPRAGGIASNTAEPFHGRP
jgi:hypothetical protein